MFLVPTRYHEFDELVGGEFILDPSGQVELVSDQGRQWLQRAPISALMSVHVRALEAGIDRSGLPVLGKLTWARVQTGCGIHRYIARIEPAKPPHVEPAKSLSNREREVADLLCLGMSNREVGAELGCSPETVKTHRKRIYRKLHVANVLELSRTLDAG